jgi:hypothetical protein
MADLPKFTMEFEPTTIEHLGLKLYSTLPPVVGELVSNAWDADASNVEITFPKGELSDKSEVVVRDDGDGMTPAALQDEYLKIGRNRREADKTDVTAKKRAVTGHKGLGKLSAFGVADQVEVRSVAGGQAICINLDYPDMKKWPAGKPYEPKVVAARTGRSNDGKGTEIRIRQLRRAKAIDESWIRREVARRFTVIGRDFKITINGSPIKPADRRLRQGCKRSWDVKELAGAGVVDADRGWTVTGWIGLVEKTSQVDRGVDIFARGKAVELDTMFGLKTTHAQFGRAYIVGEVHAEFLDQQQDYISTARNSVTWESEPGQRLQEWGQAALTDVLARWLDMKRQEKEAKVVNLSGFQEWLETRTPHEQRVAKRLVSIIVENPEIEPEAAEPMLDVVKANIEFQAFQELVDELEASATTVGTLLKLFEDWRVIEAREHLKLSDGRLESMEKLSQFIETGALEVQEMQPLFERSLWLIDPTWSTAQGQATYSKALRRNFPESTKVKGKDRRIDLLGFRLSGELHVVELKRPEKRLSREDLSQIEEYVDWARSNLQGTGVNAAKSVRGRLIVGHYSDSGEIQRKMERLAGDDILVETYRDLLERARSVYGEVERRLKDIAPEYSREARRKRRKRRK